MIDLYYWPTPNGHKVTILLEECGIPYTIKPVNIGRGDQLSPPFLKISPNGRMPAIVDHEPLGGGGPLTIFESGAIVMYLARRARQTPFSANRESPVFPSAHPTDAAGRTP